MNKSTLQVEIDGTTFVGWKRAAIDSDMEALSTSFSLSVSDTQQVLNDVNGNSSCKLVLVNGNKRTLLLDGFISEIEQDISENSISVTVTGEDRLNDLIECSAIHTQQTWLKKRFKAILNDLVSPFGIELEDSEIDDPIIEKLTIQTGEKAFDIIERLCRSQACLPTSTRDGKLSLINTKDDAERLSADLILGTNIVSFKITKNWRDRYASYLGASQLSGNGKRWTRAVVQGLAEAVDRNIDRYRPILFVAESRLNMEALQKRINWEAQVRAGRSFVYSVLVDGWYQKDLTGKLLNVWEKNKRIHLRADKYSVDIDLLITSVSFTLDAGGERTLLTMRPLDVYQQDPTKVLDNV